MNVRKIQKFVEAEPSAKILKDRTSAFVKTDLIMSKVTAVRTRTNVKNSLMIHGLHVVMATVLTLSVAIHVNVNQDIFIKERVPLSRVQSRRFEVESNKVTFPFLIKLTF